MARVASKAQAESDKEICRQKEGRCREEVSLDSDGAPELKCRRLEAKGADRAAEQKKVISVGEGTGSRRKQRVGIIGFGTFGQFLARRMVQDLEVYATSREDYRKVAGEMGVGWCTSLGGLLQQKLDVLLISVSIMSLEGMVRRVTAAMKEQSSSSGGPGGMLVVDVASVKMHARTTMHNLLPESCDVLCTHPMFGPKSGAHSWGGLPFVFDRVRCSDVQRCEDFLTWWRKQGCEMVEMSCEAHDKQAARSQFVTHLTGRVLGRLSLDSTPMNTKAFDALLDIVDGTCQDSDDLFHALYKFNPQAGPLLEAYATALDEVSKKLRETAASK